MLIRQFRRVNLLRQHLNLAFQLLAHNRSVADILPDGINFLIHLGHI